MAAQLNLQFNSTNSTRPIDFVLVCAENSRRKMFGTALALALSMSRGKIFRTKITSALLLTVNRDIVFAQGDSGGHPEKRSGEDFCRENKHRRSPGVEFELSGRSVAVFRPANQAGHAFAYRIAGLAILGRSSHHNPCRCEVTMHGPFVFDYYLGGNITEARDDSVALSAPIAFAEVPPSFPIWNVPIMDDHRNFVCEEEEPCPHYSHS